VNDLIIPTVDTVRQKFFLDTYVSHSKPLLFVGPTGTGKSAITNNYLVQLPKDKYVCVCMYPVTGIRVVWIIFIMNHLNFYA
jgi:dynein heavy chain